MVELTPEIAREFVDYDPQTGICLWKHRDRKWFKADRIYKMWNTRYAGERCFNTECHEYMAGAIFKKLMLAHRFIWFYVHGYWPIEIDHKNRRKTDNRLKNLREVTKSQNMKNTKLSKTNTSGRVGVYWYPNYNKWLAKINKKPRPINLGYFNTFEEACYARKQGEIKYGFDPNHGKEIVTN